MKQLKISLVALFTLVYVVSINAQDKNNFWTAGFGLNNVDFINVDANNRFSDYFEYADSNILPSISTVSISKYLKKGFSIQLMGSINQISNILEATNSDFRYFSIDTDLKYNLNNLWNDNIEWLNTPWFDPYLFLGIGYTSLNSIGDGMFNLGLGFNIWFTDGLGLNFHTGMKQSIISSVQTHYQQSLGIVVKFGGNDTDGDGVYDKYDSCPKTPGLEEFDGCPDTDADGVIDSEDACPDVPGLLSTKGCPDADGDEILDKDDKCPNVKGIKANKGCPDIDPDTDTDGDGVPDINDECYSVVGLVANAGCPSPDTDADGLLDIVDDCPLVAGPVSNGGCPETIDKKKIGNNYKDVVGYYKEKMGVNTFVQTIQFQIDGFNLKPSFIKVLNAMIKRMNEFPKSKFIIIGYTDSTGSFLGNLILSNKRANSVKSYLVKKGIDPTRFIIRGFGEDSPLNSNKTKYGRIKNRRVEIKITN